jgi:hypothetical protein
MNDKPNHRHGSMAGAILLIAVGVVFLYATLHPAFNLWPFLERYWPLILIFLGLAKLWDYFWVRSHPDSARGGEISGIALALLLVALIAGLAYSHSRHHRLRSFGHRTQTAVDLQGAKSVHAKIEMPAGRLDVAGGASQFFRGDFDYAGFEDPPRVEYSVNGGVGQLEVRQPEAGFHLGPTDNTWDLRFRDDVPLEMYLDMGAGEGNLRLRGMDVTSLKVEMGAGRLDLDLTGGRQHDLEADIHGGVGQATIRLPRDVGVRVHASGGLGAVNASGLKREGDTYVNDAYGRTPAAIRMNVEGGVGAISLEQEP